MKARWLALSLLVLLLVGGWKPAQQEGTVAVIGDVSNGTAGVGIPAGQPVSVHVFLEGEETGTDTTAIASDGSFRLDDVPAREGDLVVARVVHQGVTYTSDFVSVDPGRQEITTPVVVYETTEDLSSVLISQLHLFASVDGETLQISEYYLISNTGDRTYVGEEDPPSGRRPTLVFSLPDGAMDLRFEGQGLGERYLDLQDSFADTQPVRPGTATVETLFNYGLPYRAGMRIERTFKAPVASVVLLMQEARVALEGEGINSAGVLDTQAGPALSYTAGPLAEGEVLAFRLVEDVGTVAGAPAGGAPVRNTTQETVVGLVALAAAAAAVYLMWRPAAAEPPRGRARSLAEEIAGLDREFEAGQVGQAAYRKRRESLRRQLRALLEDRHRKAGD